ncbi:hypothetical protein [Lichenibacterium ramalinae]|uniref:Pentapeptide MXKDX repeat protein n=1 Tax=Lichenibacterium ramalinae TaxID=2316527 RepID=A0A4Q2R7A8_9HYPH|nr:hypothetical protein [Lichenibacterium ramalinae]RYB01364.1 hypothetical protein D3272_26540 [Lichenibacterium ramalinae]
MTVIKTKSLIIPCAVVAVSLCAFMAPASAQMMSKKPMMHHSMKNSKMMMHKKPMMRNSMMHKKMMNPM